MGAPLLADFARSGDFAFEFRVILRRALWPDEWTYTLCRHHRRCSQSPSLVLIPRAVLVLA